MKVLWQDYQICSKPRLQRIELQAAQISSRRKLKSGAYSSFTWTSCSRIRQVLQYNGLNSCTQVTDDEDTAQRSIKGYSHLGKSRFSAIPFTVTMPMCIQEHSTLLWVNCSTVQGPCTALLGAQVLWLFYMFTLLSHYSVYRTMETNVTGEFFTNDVQMVKLQ